VSDVLTPRVRSAIEALPTYKAGKKAQAVDALAPYKLSSNEIALEPLPSVLAVITDAAQEINRYPDPFATELMAALAQKINVSVDHIAIGTGSVGVCQQIVQAMVDAGDEVIFAWRSFEAYPIIASIAGAVSVPVPLLSDGSHDLDGMAAAVTPKTKVIFLCTPNNPTGNVISQSQFDAFITQIPADILVVIDEAYVEFNRDEDAVNGVASMLAHSNVGILRTFSKAYGLAALRVGYFVGPQHIAQAVAKTAVPFGVSSIAQAAAVESLRCESELLARVDMVTQQRVKCEEQLGELGVDLHPSQANFMWWALGLRTDEFAQLCTEHAIAIRAFSGEGVRISIGEPEAMQRFVDIVREFLTYG
jgi:histidinol-phosphate aminotransferase